MNPNCVIYHAWKYRGCGIHDLTKIPDIITRICTPYWSQQVSIPETQGLLLKRHLTIEPQTWDHPTRLSELWDRGWKLSYFFSKYALAFIWCPSMSPLLRNTFKLVGFNGLGTKHFLLTDFMKNRLQMHWPQWYRRTPRPENYQHQIPSGCKLGIFSPLFSFFLGLSLLMR